MNNKFEVRCKYVKQLEDGTYKELTNPFIFHGVTFGDVETLAYSYMGEFYKENFSIEAIKKDRIEEIFYYDEEEMWFSSDVTITNLEDKPIKLKFLVNAKDIKEAHGRLTESITPMYAHFEIKLIKETKIQDVLK